MALSIACPRSAVRKDDQREVLGIEALGSHQVRGDLASVPCRVANGLHRRELIARQRGPRVVELRQRALSAIIEVDGTRIHVARHGDERPRLVLGCGGVADLAIGKLAPQPLEFAAQSLGARVDACPVAHIDSTHKLLVHVREPGAAEVHLALGIGVDDFRLAASHIHKQEPREIDGLVAHEVDALAVLVDSSSTPHCTTPGPACRPPPPASAVQPLSYEPHRTAEDDPCRDIGVVFVGAPRYRCRADRHRERGVPIIDAATISAGCFRRRRSARGRRRWAFARVRDADRAQQREPPRRCGSPRCRPCPEHAHSDCPRPEVSAHRPLESAVIASRFERLVDTLDPMTSR